MVTESKTSAAARAISPLAGKFPPANLLIDVDALLKAYRDDAVDFADVSKRVLFGTSGHRGCPLKGTFQDMHVAAITQAVVEYRRSVRGLTGPLFIGFDTHAVSSSAQRTAVEVLVANGIDVRVQNGGGVTPTPAISHAIIQYNHSRNGEGLADGLIITPSHNPPSDAGVKYNPPHGGPAESSITATIERLANGYLENGNRDVKRTSDAGLLNLIATEDFLTRYVADLPMVVDLEAIRAAGVKIGVHPLGGAAVEYWREIARVHRLDIRIVNDAVDPTFSFMTVDHDGKIRMDCSSPYAMESLVAMKDTFDVAIGNDPDADRHGIVTPTGGLMNPNHFLAVAIDYLFKHRPAWPSHARVGKTIVSSSLIDKVAAGLGREIFEVPVGFKWFVSGLSDSSLGFGGEESAGASFLCHDGSPWSTDKDGIILGLLAAEIQARTGMNPDQYLKKEIVSRYGMPAYERIDTPMMPASREKVARLSAETLPIRSLGGEPIEAVLVKAPGNGQSVGGVVIRTRSAWVAVRPSGTEPILKTYAESWKGDDHLWSMVAELKEVLS